MPESEVLAAQILLQPVRNDAADRDLDAEIARVEQELDRIACHPPKGSYAVAVLCGILSGAVDAMLFRELPFQSDQLNTEVQTLFDRLRTLDPKALAPGSGVSHRWHRPVEGGIPADLPFLNGLAGQANPFGLCAAILKQCGQGGLLNARNGEIRLFPEGVSKEDGIAVMVISASVGIMKWFAGIAKGDALKADGAAKWKGFAPICDLVRSAPAFDGIVAALEKWQKQLPNEIKKNKDKISGNMGLSQILLSFFSMIAGLPEFRDTKLPQAVNLISESRRIRLHETAIGKRFGRQALPVLLNEVLVRTAFFVMRLSEELSVHAGINDVDWKKVLPFHNRTVDRMIAIASATFSMADTADAAVHAAIDSAGNWTVFSLHFVKRFNYVGAGRAALAVFGEFSYEKQHAQLLEERRILIEERSARIVEQLQAYKQQLAERLSGYLAEDLESFLHGFETMDRGLQTGDADLVLKGSVVIQRVLGHEPQFTTQEEFDDLMDSDLSLQL